LIHATNAWNPTGHNLLGVPDTRLYYLHAEALSGQRTSVFLGTQHHLVFVADLPGHVPPAELRERVLSEAHLYPHLVDLEPPAGAPRVFADPADGT
jgi:hypothetical protein